MNNAHYYEVNLVWNPHTQGTPSSPVIMQKVEVVTPGEFPRRIKEKWTSEHLFIGAINSCLMSTFLQIADNSKLEFISFECKAVGKIEKVDGKFAVTKIVLKPRLVIPSTQHADRAKRILEMSETSCVISNSVTTKIILELNIIVN